MFAWVPVGSRWRSFDRLLGANERWTVADFHIPSPVRSIVGTRAIIAGVIIYTGPMRFGGFIAVIGGIILLLITSFATPAILVFVAGIIGLIGAAIKPPWWKFWKR